MPVTIPEVKALVEQFTVAVVPDQLRRVQPTTCEVRFKVAKAAADTTLYEQVPITLPFTPVQTGEVTVAPVTWTGHATSPCLPVPAPS
jgi:hypothetical protein